MIPNNSDDVGREFNFMIPQGMHVKEKIFRDYPSLSKKPTTEKINLRHLIEGESEVSSGREE